MHITKLLLGLLYGQIFVTYLIAIKEYEWVHQDTYTKDEVFTRNGTLQEKLIRTHWECIYTSSYLAQTRTDTPRKAADNLINTPLTHTRIPGRRQTGHQVTRQKGEDQGGRRPGQEKEEDH
jgi:hypothetical protein